MLNSDLGFKAQSIEYPERKQKFVVTFKISLAEDLLLLNEKIISMNRELIFERMGVKNIVIDFSLWKEKTREEAKNILNSILLQIK